MTINRLIVFAQNGDKNTDDLDLVRGFPSRLQPARQWMNYLFNMLSVKINEIIGDNEARDESYDTRIKAILASNKLTDSDLRVLTYSPIPFPSNTIPDGFIALAGQTISRDRYPILHSLYGGVLPDLRGEFIRGADSGRGIDADRQPLSWQGDDFKSHNHDVLLATFGHGRDGRNDRIATWSDGDVIVNQKTLINSSEILKNNGGKETRPRNVAFNYIVKAG